MKRNLIMTEAVHLIVPTLVGVTVALELMTIADGATVIIAYFMWVTVNVTKRLEKERNRPLVVSNLTDKDGYIRVEVRNDGLGLAKDVSVKIPHELEVISGRADFVLNDPLPFLSPSRMRFVNLDRIEKFSQIDNLEFYIDVSYKDTTGVEYKDSFLCDLTLVMRGLSDG